VLKQLCVNRQKKKGRIDRWVEMIRFLNVSCVSRRTPAFDIHSSPTGATLAQNNRMVGGGSHYFHLAGNVRRDPFRQILAALGLFPSKYNEKHHLFRNSLYFVWVTSWNGIYT